MAPKKTLGITDTYVRRARLEPAALVALPLALATLAWSPGGIVGWGLLWGVFVWCGGTGLLAQVARDRGRRKEPELFAAWGGKPTTRFLRHRDAPNKITLGRQHKKLQKFMTGVRLPTVGQENTDPNRADDIYDACTGFLLEKTRDRKSFPLIFEENCNYGFRRNLWGMKPIGLLTSFVGIVLSASVVYTDYHNRTQWGTGLVASVINLFLLLGWTFWFTPGWVRIPAEAYAQRLLAACENL